MRQGLERFLKNGSCELAVDQDAVCHACGVFFHPVDWGPVQAFKKRISPSEQQIWEVTIKQDLLTPSGQLEYWDTGRHLVKAKINNK